ncbi:hypothetical protein LCGC14_1937300 [marine sediment metagenome]|uniref:Tc1-like transposase DDE domain-containing protein n=1 Tax=marine sediment metagenome TaxID=412755 RepID=A0A0F9FL89_9ZZZZ
MSQQGKALSSGQKLSIVNLKKSFDKERKLGPTVFTKDSIGRVAKGLDIGRRTVENILADYNKNNQTLIELPPKSRGKPPLRVSGDLVSSIRHHIRSMNLQGEHISVRSLRAWLIQEFKIDIPIMTLWRALRRIGFTYGRNKRRSTLKERDYVISARRKYLREKISNRNDNGTLKRPEVYLDETYLNKNHSNDNAWFLDEDGPWVNKPSGKGPRLIIVHAITINGWVNGAKLVFQAKISTGDYHGQMNYENFSKWFSNQLLPNIPSDSIIIMDNAKYHNILADDTFPTPRSNKRELQAWLENNHSNLNLHDDPSMLKAELYEICKKIAPPPEFKLDCMAEKHGHRILRTPQYHCELQPIESCWGIVKNFCRNHCDFTMKGLNKQLHYGFSKVSKATCQKLIEKVRQQEDLFWKEDAEVDAREMIEKGTKYSVENYINAEEEKDFE